MFITFLHIEISRKRTCEYTYVIQSWTYEWPKIHRNSSIFCIGTPACRLTLLNERFLACGEVRIVVIVSN